MQYASLT